MLKNRYFQYNNCTNHSIFWVGMNMQRCDLIHNLLICLALKKKMIINHLSSHDVSHESEHNCST